MSVIGFPRRTFFSSDTTGLKAVLGPTNTGKTHLAIERMVAHSSGIIGLPLRLLAREVYTRVVEKVGRDQVALVTGEEKIVPAGARYSVCTVEALPRRTEAAFVAIDEVQLAGDLERGHIFTNRLLHLRGREETLLLGADTVRGLIQHLLPGIEIVTRPRLSHLSYTGSRKLTRLPRRSAIVGFSADEVYAIAELVRRRRGGAAVVLGALSPRTRNAQVEIYQAGDVDYLVATDAIGMGLNLDIDHVAFAQDHKFDGRYYRPLNPAELAQVAGRAGRHVKEGTFGTTGRAGPFSEETARRIEGHDFAPVQVLQWRSTELDFSSLGNLVRSLDRPAPGPGLTRSLPATDERALDFLGRDDDVVALADSPLRVELLWDTCALPDYRKIAPAQHCELISAVFTDLAQKGHIDETYMAGQVARADRPEGDIDTLSARIAEIRTWTYISNRPNWLRDPLHWQQKTREIEDRLSDALHERLTKRFVDRRTSVLMQRLRENVMLTAQIDTEGDVTVEGHHVGKLQGFRFTADPEVGGEDAKAIQAAAQKALAGELETRAARLAASGNGDFALAGDGTLRWLGEPVGRLSAGEHSLRPNVLVLAGDPLSGPGREAVARRLERFVRHHVDSLLKPLVDLDQADELEGMTRGIAFQIVESFGVLPRRQVAREVRDLSQDQRATLRRLGVRFGAYHLYLPVLLKPAPAELMTLLWALKNDGQDKPGFGELVPQLHAGRTSLVTDPAFSRDFYPLAGFSHLGKRAVRVDMLERLADLVRPAAQWSPGNGARPDGAYDGKGFMITAPMLSICGATRDDMVEILKGLGYRSEQIEAENVSARLAEIDAASKQTTDPVGAASIEGAAASKPPDSEPRQASQNESGGVVTGSDDGKVSSRDNSSGAVASVPAQDQQVDAGGAEAALIEPDKIHIWSLERAHNARRKPDGQRKNARSKQTKPAGPEGQAGRPQGNGKPRADKQARRHAGSARPQERPVRIDPDSPFAKLAALKEQMKNQ